MTTFDWLYVVIMVTAYFVFLAFIVRFCLYFTKPYRDQRRYEEERADYLERDTQEMMRRKQCRRNESNSSNA